ncbi:GDP-mannose 4,6-dehydratase [Candidatus Pelagibacter sp.]|jgi:NAD dependent epimerase/dehydratase|nr:GDP-mannose 4,6-dehydratase [Candidatus Pelagibacter sp.]
MKKILITGSEGFIGSHLTEYLLQKKYKISALVYYNSFQSNGWLDNIEPKLFKKINIIYGDLRDKSFLIEISKKHDAIIHLGALIAIPYSYVAPDSYVQTNILGTLNILEAAKINNIKKIIITSTSEIYGRSKKFPIKEYYSVDPRSPYSATKISADQIALSYFYSYNLPVTIIRPFNTVGPRQSQRAVIPTIINQFIDNKKSLKLGSLDTRRNFNSVFDIVRGFELSLKTKKNIAGEVINLGSSFEIAIKDLVKLISKIEKKKLEIVSEKKRIRPNESEVLRLTASNIKAKKLLNWKPKINNLKQFELFLKYTIKWFKKNRSLYSKDSSKYTI